MRFAKPIANRTIFYQQTVDQKEADIELTRARAQKIKTKSFETVAKTLRGFGFSKDEISRLLRDPNSSKVGRDVNTIQSAVDKGEIALSVTLDPGFESFVPGARIVPWRLIDVELRQGDRRQGERRRQA
jgi:hypothetical protein